MAEVLLFHHIQGLTDGVTAFADDLRAGGHTVHTPDLFDGQTFGTIEEGFALHRRASRAIDAGRRRGGGAAPRTSCTPASPGASRPPAAGPDPARREGRAVLESCIPISGEWAFGPWPDGVPVQIHGREGDEFFEEDNPAAREIVESRAGPAELFVYPGDAHLFTDRSLPAYDAEAAALVIQRSLAFLDRL